MNRVSYHLNKNGAFIGESTLPRVIRKINTQYGKVILYSNRKVTFMNIDHRYFSDNRDTSIPYWFMVTPGVPIYRLYGKYSKILDAPDPIYGDSIKAYNSIYKKYKNSIWYPIIELNLLLKISYSYFFKKYIKINPLEFRFLWDIEEILEKEYNTFFTYFVSLNSQRVKNVDILFIPEPIDKEVFTDTYYPNSIKRHYQLIFHMLSGNTSKDIKKIALKNMIEAVMYMGIYDLIIESIDKFKGGDI